jgi:phage tail sheath protein FI
MATAYVTPGVYVEEISNLPPSVAGVATAIPAFIGYTKFATQKTVNDLVMKPTRISSMVEYEQYFGGADLETNITVSVTSVLGVASATATLLPANRSPHMMWYALRMYFDNGGGPCYICSVAATYATIDETALENGLAAVGKVDEPTLIVFPEAQQLPIANYLALHEKALQQCAVLQDRFVIMDMHGGDLVSLDDPATNLVTAAGTFRTSGTSMDNLKYGAAYAPNIETVVPIQYNPAVTAVTIVTTTTTGTTTSNAMLSALQATDTQSYNLAVSAIGGLTCKLPPSGAVAGIYATVDSTRGVWKAPANVGIVDVIQPTIAINDIDQGSLNVDPTSGKSVNAIRAFTGLGTLVWGARTLAGNDNEWRYINVRRLCIYAEESIRKAAQQFVFEPNDANTWVKVQGMIENFLTTLWRQGALMGSKPADAFTVTVGLGKTMSALDVLEGRMIVVVGLCPVRPAEFIVLRIVQTMPVS